MDRPAVSIHILSTFTQYRCVVVNGIGSKTVSPRGGIGRRSRLRIYRLTVCRFESGWGYQALFGAHLGYTHIHRKGQAKA